MYKIFGHYIPKTLLLLGFAESVILFISVYIAISFTIGIGAGNYYGDHEPLLMHSVFFSAVMLAAMTAMGLYRRDLRDRFLTISLRIFLSLLIGLLVLFTFYVFYPETFVNGNVILISVLSSFLGILFCRILWCTLTNTYAKRVMIVGAGEKAQQLEGLRRKSDRFGVEIAGYIDISNDAGGCAVQEDRILKHVNGEPFKFAEFITDHNIDEIVIAMDERRQRFPADEILEVKLRGVHVVDVNTFMERQLGKIDLNSLRPSSFIFSDGFTQHPLKAINKRFLDVTISSILLILTLPVTLLTALAIYLGSGCCGTIIYRQERVGVNHKKFNVLKFRSMREDAEEDGIAKWASVNDNRVTRIGAFIRKTRIDELPQLINVLLGDMSFVGPRPERPQFIDDLADNIPYYKLRHHIKPGITGWAQICYPYGASIQDAREKLQYDLYYLKHHNIFLDLLILVQTAAVILLQKGSR